MGNRRETSFTPAVVVLNILIVVITAMLGLFLYLYMTSPLPPSPPAPPPASGQSTPSSTLVAAPTENEPSETVTTLPPATTIPEMTKSPFSDSYTPGSRSADGTDEPSPPNDYDKVFFGDTLFIGDSISTGFSGYGLIPAANVFADIGMSPSGALTAEINGRGVIETAAGFDRVVLMLGTNGLSASNAALIAESMKTLANTLKSARPSAETVILTVPPVAPNVGNSYNISIDMINEYNSLLAGVARETGCILIDVCSALKDENGYLKAQYAQPDGMHLTVSAYEALLSFVQSELE
ncbi:MAG: SGNH/GDSL hydrolase family protein [Oscillospiraceae bacterium]|jgi:hypothetical protein|nr:SGNH/GDSL hydrolase family protein [Oscillospiraceae bacterium]